MVTDAVWDDDGDKDLVIGNLGLNAQFHATEKQPMSMYYKDFDKNGSTDPVFCYYIDGVSYPAASRDDLMDHQLKGNSTTTKDPRLNVMSILWVKQADKSYKADTATALQKGMQNAQFNGYPADFETYSEPNVDVVYSYSAPFVVMGPAEVNFLLGGCFRYAYR